MQLRRFLGNSSLYLLANIASKAAAFLMIPFYTGHLAPADYGIIEQIELIIQVLSLLLGLQVAGSSMIRIYHDAPEGPQRRSVISTTFAGAFGINLVLALAGLLAAAVLSSLVFESNQYTGLIRWSLFAMVFSNMAELGLAYQQMRNHAVVFVAYSLLQLAATLALNVYFIGAAGLGIWGFVYSKIIVSSAGALVLCAFALRDNGLAFSREHWRKLVAFGSPLILAYLAYFVIHFEDRFLLQRWHGSAPVGVYGLAYRFAFLVPILVMEPFNRVWNVNQYVYAEKSGWQQQFAEVARVLAFLLCLVGLGLCLFGDTVIHLMARNPGYYGAIPVLPILVGAYVIRSLGDFFANTLYINKRSDMVSRIAVGAAIFNTCLNFALIPSYGMMGAAWATFATWSAYFVFCLLAAGKEYQIPFPLSAAATVLGLAAVIFLLAQTMPRFDLGLSIAVQLSWLCAFGLLLWTVKYFPKLRYR